MIIVFTSEERTRAPSGGTRTARPTSHHPRFTSNRPLPDVRIEEEAVFTDPFGPGGASAR
jgi:hypothetical protein